MSPKPKQLNLVALDEKLARMRDVLCELGTVAVAFSGGVDSALVLAVAIDTLGAENVVAVTGRSDSLASAEFAGACDLADTLGAEHVVLDTKEFDKPDYVSNPANRCYYCKSTLYDEMAVFVADRGLGGIVNGTNRDDLGDYRPGLIAATEHKVRAPAVEADMDKADVRELARRFGLSVSEKPASPCLSSRLPYGATITPEKLRMIEAGESFLHELGVRECRVRHHDTIARIEVPQEYLPKLVDPECATSIDRHFRELGYQCVTIDLRGFRSGSMNEFISLNLPE